ncbi:MAG: hypothetical protein ACRC4M_03485 [Mycoplasma sp.]
MNKQKLQRSTLNILNAFPTSDKQIFGEMLATQFKNLLKKIKVKSILIVLNSNFEPHIENVINYCLQNNISVHLVSRKRNKIAFVKINNLNYKIEIFKYTNQPAFKKTKYSKGELDFDLVLFPIMAYDKTLKFLDYDAKLNIDLIQHPSISKVKKCGYCLCVQELSDLIAHHDARKIDYLITEFNCYTK